jgi:hypothetical protein
MWAELDGAREAVGVCSDLRKYSARFSAMREWTKAMRPVKAFEPSA